MRTVALLVALIVSMLAGLAACAEQQMKPDSLRLVPWPKKITIGSGAIVVPATLRIKTSSADPAARRVAETLADDLRQLGFTPANKGPKIVLAISPDKSLGEEGYRLRVTDSINISAATEKGLFWGTRTFLQLAAKGPGQVIPRLAIFDKPEFAYRSLLIDPARQFHSIGFHRQMVKGLAQYKIDVYQIHFTDDQSWTLPSDKYPSLPTPGRHYTKKELKALVRLAARYHVAVIPEIEMPGHSGTLCAAVPNATCTGKTSGMICIGSDRSFNVLKTVIAEAMEIFPGPYFHIGADEVNLYAGWDKCPDCAARKVSERLKNNESLYNWFVNRVNRFVRSKGRRTVLWECFKPATEPAIDKNVLVMMWYNYYASPVDVMKAGYDIVNSSFTPLYVVRNQASPPELIAQWSPLLFGAAPMGHPLDKMIRIAPSKLLKGVNMCAWENEERAEEALLFGTGVPVEGYAAPGPRVPIMAERAWTGDATKADDLLQRVGAK